MAENNNQRVAPEEALFLNAWLPKLSLYTPFSSGSFEQKIFLTFQSISRIFPVIESSLEQFGHKKLALQSLDKIEHDASGKEIVRELERLFNYYGSDKAREHGYHLLYAQILDKAGSIFNVLEIGMGSNNEDVVSNMGANGKPGASLRAFRDFLPHALIYGADVDKRILFSEDRIRTFFVDQTVPASFDQLAHHLPDAFDLIIDDGLHSPDANLTTLSFALQKIKVGGWVIIEDINREALSFWQLIAALLPSNFEKHVFQTLTPYIIIFGVKRIY